LGLPNDEQITTARDQALLGGAIEHGLERFLFCREIKKLIEPVAWQRCATVNARGRHVRSIPDCFRICALR
jgi:hypothetical protein